MSEVESNRDRFRHLLEEQTGKPFDETAEHGMTVNAARALLGPADGAEPVGAGGEGGDDQETGGRAAGDQERGGAAASSEQEAGAGRAEGSDSLQRQDEEDRGAVEEEQGPQAREPGADPPLHKTPHEEAQGERRDSPNLMGDFRKKLDDLLKQHEDRRKEEELPEELCLDSDEDGDELLPLESESSEAALAEEEERRWRQGLLQKEVELRDWTATIDSKEKLLEQLMKEKAENEKLKQAYEVRMQAYAEAVKSAEHEAHTALEKLEKIKTQDETEKVRLMKEHQMRVKELEAKVSKLRTEEKGYSRWIQQRDRDQQRITSLQQEIEKGKQSKAELVRKMKEDETRYREWRERHHKEVQQLKRTAQKAEYTIKKLERENAHFKSVLRRREEERAALQRNNREIALAHARVAKAEKISAPTVSSSVLVAQGEGGRQGLQVRTRSQVALSEKVDRFKMNRAKTRLKNMLEEYGQRGKLQAELSRLKADNKQLGAEVREEVLSRDKLQLELERKTVSSVKRSQPMEAWAEKRESKDRTSEMSSCSSVDDLQEHIELLNEGIEEKSTRMDYNKERIAQIDKKLKSLPDFESSSGLWADDDTMEVPEAYAPIREANGAEAKFLLRFLFKKAALFRESDLKHRAQIELQRIAIEEQNRDKEKAVGALRRAQLQFENRCVQLQSLHEEKCLLLYSKVNEQEQEQEGGRTPDKLLPPSTPGGMQAENLRDIMRMRNEELALLRNMNETLREKNEDYARKLEQVEQELSKDSVISMPTAIEQPSEAVKALSEKLSCLKKVIQKARKESEEGLVQEEGGELEVLEVGGIPNSKQTVRTSLLPSSRADPSSRQGSRRRRRRGLTPAETSRSTCLTG
eukprot:754936-Hanusia_phi.AAC.4